MITSILLVLAGVVVSIIIGTLWYMPSTPTGKIHMRYIGFDKLSPEEQKLKMEAAKPGMPKIYAATLAFNVDCGGAHCDHERHQWSITISCDWLPCL